MVPKGKIIIIEGPDGAGKSTLALQLAESFNARVIHTGPPSKDEPAITQYYNTFRELMLSDENVILDRFHLGERVYGPILRGIDSLGLAGQRLLETKMRTRGGVVLVRCLPPFETCRRNWSARRNTELFTDFEVFVKTYTAFKDLPSMLPTVRYDYSQSSPAEVVCALQVLFTRTGV